MKTKYLITCMSLALITGGLSACGSGGSTSTSDQISSVGTITGFGSIYVNGIEFETTHASYRVDDEDAFDDSSLAVGMKVKVVGSVNSDGVTGMANQVYYDYDIEGPIDTASLNLDTVSGIATFTILGLDIKASANSTVYDNGASFSGLIEGQKLEISGYFDGSQIIASRIEKQNYLDSEFELKGTVTAYDGSTVTLSLQNSALAGPYTISGSAILEIPADPVGEFVEIKLIDQSGSLLVTKIESDDDDLLDDDDHKVSIRGILSDDGNGGLLINGIAFEFNDSTEFKPTTLENNLVANQEVKIEGYMQNGILIAEEIETEHGDIEIKASVSEVIASDQKNGSITLNLGNAQSLVVITDNSTQFIDDSSFDLNQDDSFNLDELVNSNFVEIDAYLNDSDQLVATQIKRKEAGEDTRLEAPVTSFSANTSVTLLDVTYTVTAATSYEINDLPSDANTFFSALAIGNRTVEVKDIQPDGLAEELDIED